MIIYYFDFAFGFYLGLSLNNPESFLTASSAGLIRGFLLCFLFWPIGLIAKVVQILLEESAF